MNDITIRFLEVYSWLKSENFVANPKNFATKIEVSTSLITEICKSRTNAGITPIQNLINQFPQINANWLLTGKGEMIVESNYHQLEERLNEVAEPQNNITAYDYERLIAAEKEINLLLRDKIEMLLEKNENLKKELEHYEPGPDVSRSSEKLKK